MKDQKPYITSYKTQLLVLGVIIAITLISIAFTRVEMGPFNTVIIMLLAGLQAALVISWFMKLKFNNKIFLIFTILVITVFLLVLLITFFDYLYR